MGYCLMAVWAGGLLASLPALSVHAQGRVRPRIKRGVAIKPQRSVPANPPRVTPTRPNRVLNAPPNGARLKAAGKVDPVALQLLAKMLRPSVNYEGVEVSNVSMNGAASEETIWGNANGWTRREYMQPDSIRGDIVLTAPNQSYQFHNREKRLDVAHWPVEMGDKNARLRALAKAGRVRIQITGEEMVAGRSATIVTITALTAGAASEARQVMFLDKETGIRLRMDRYNSAGQQISSTYMKTITVGTASDASRFDPRLLPPATTTFPLFPEGQPMFTSVEQARGQVPFTIKAPTQMPAGYALDGVWVFAENARANRASVLLRYSSGVNHFSLFETLLPNKAARLLRPGQLRPRRAPGGWFWRTEVPEGDISVQYTGHLPEADLLALHSSMQ